MKQSDKFWEYAEKTGVRFICKFCKKDFAGGISRVKSHLSGIQGRDVAVCLSVPEEVQAAAVVVIGLADGASNGTKRKRSISSTGSVSFDVEEDSVLQQTSIPRMMDRKDKEGVDMKVALCFFQNNIPFNVIQSPAFIDMCKGISDYGLGYVLPSYSTLRTKLVVNTRAAVELYVDVVKESWSVTGCTIMSDIWTDLKRKSFLNVVAYSPKGAVFLKSVERSGERNTGLFIKGILMSVIEEIGPENVVQIVTDNASNYGLACNLVMEEHPHIITTKCVAHGVQLLFDDINDTVDWVSDMFVKARKIYDNLYRHTTVLDLMRVHTNGRDLRKYSKTRFASHFLMLQSILDVEDGLRNLVASAEWRAMTYSKHADSVVVKNTIQGTAFWDEGKELLSGMEPLVRVLRLVDGDGSTSSYIYEAVHRARKFLQTRCLDDPVRYMTIWDLFERRVSSNLLHVVHAAAMYLNPSFMFDGKIHYDSEDVQKGLMYIGDKMIDITERIQFANELLVYNGRHPKIFSYLSEAQMRSVHPRVWWEANGSHVPLLKRIAVRLLSQPCSASPCERNWSAFDGAQTKRRNRLTPEMLDNLVYIRVNSLMLQKSVNFEQQDRKPITLTLEDLAELHPESVDEHLDEAADEAYIEVSPFAQTGQTVDESWLDRLTGIGSNSRANNARQ